MKIWNPANSKSADAGSHDMKKIILFIALVLVISSLGNIAYAADRQQLDWEKPCCLVK